MVNKTKMGGLKQNIRLGVSVKNSTKKKKEIIGTKKGLKQNNRINIESPTPQKKVASEFVKSVIDNAVTKVKGTATPNATTDATVKARSDNNAVTENKASQDKINIEKEYRAKLDIIKRNEREIRKQQLNNRLIVLEEANKAKEAKKAEEAEANPKAEEAEAKLKLAAAEAKKAKEVEDRSTRTSQSAEKFAENIIPDTQANLKKQLKVHSNNRTEKQAANRVSLIDRYNRRKDYDDIKIKNATGNKDAHEEQRFRIANYKKTPQRHVTSLTGGGKTKKNTNKRTSRNNKPSKKNKTRRK